MPVHQLKAVVFIPGRQHNYNNCKVKNLLHLFAHCVFFFLPFSHFLYFIRVCPHYLNKFKQ
jgi:hypothetical protein